MDEMQENVEEDKKYAFLLGSALRNEDPDQLLTVYDNLIPGHFPFTRLERIKEGARHISELSDHDFSALVLNARTFSLAPGLSSMSQAGGRSSMPDPEGDHPASSAAAKLDGVGSLFVSRQSGPNCCNSLPNSVTTRAQPIPPTSLSVKLDLAGASADEDSGIPDSSVKAPSSVKNSVSCSDSANGDSEEERAGVFDYTPSTTELVRITPTYNPTFDEEVKLDSSTGGSSIESPRSETSVTHDEYNLEGTEMNTLNYQELPVMEGEEHRYLYGRSRRSHEHEQDCWDYVPSARSQDDENVDDDEDDHPSSFCRDPPASFRPTFRSAAAPVPVDKGISYLPCDPRPTSRAAANSYNLSQDSQRDKKTIRSKDDSDKPELHGTVDVNGNPLLSEHSDFFKANYPQMRQSPGGKSENAASGSVATFSPNLTSAPTSSQSSYSSSASDQTSDPIKRKLERRKRQQEKKKVPTAGELYGDLNNYKDIDKIVVYIEGEKKTGKEINSADLSKADSKSTKKKQERNKKKDQPMNGPLAPEKAAGEAASGCVRETAVVTAPARPGPGAMGNSTGKAGGHHDHVSKPGSTEEDLDKSNNEFHDCLNAVPEDLVISAKDQQQNKMTENNKKTSVRTLDTEKSKAEGISDKVPVDNHKISNNKKSSKAKGKKDKQDGSGDDGPLSPKTNMVKPKELIESEDFVSHSITMDNNTVNSIEPEFHSELKREDSFTEVKKKKKRTGTKELSMASLANFSPSPYYNQNTNGPSYRNNPRPRPSTPPPAPVPSTVVSGSSLPVGEPTSMPRDLSPSSFPVLSSHGTAAPRLEGRRNSCGDISTECMDSKTYDSDRESAKSLPDAHGVRAAGEMSPVYPRSYATIAAAPRRYDSTNSPSSESGVASGSQNSSVNSSMTHTPGSSIDIMSPQSPANPALTPDRKATVWKGSPRERRHSIGSSPEDKFEVEKSSVAQKNRQCGSQEVLSRSVAASVGSTSKDGGIPSSSAPVKVIHTSHSSNSLQSATEGHARTIQTPAKVVPSQVKNGVPQASVKATASVTRSQTTQPSGGTAPVPVSSSQPIPTGSATVVPSQSKAMGQPMPVFDLRGNKGKECSGIQFSAPEPSSLKYGNRSSVATAVTNSAAVSSSVADTTTKTSTVSSRIKHASPAPEAARKTGGTTNNTKSVIFLDKRFGSSPPQNLGITFGFDSSFESSSDSASQHTSTSQSQPQTVPSAQPQFIATLPSLLCSSTQSTSSPPQKQLPSPAAPQGRSHIPTAAAPAAPESTNSLVSAASVSPNDHSKHSQVPKGPHIQGPRNGLILPSNPAVSTSQQQQSSVVTSEVFRNSPGSDKSIVSSSRTSSCPVKSDTSSGSNLNSGKEPGPLVLPGLPNPSAADLANNPLAQINKSTSPIAGPGNVVITRANPAGVTFSPNQPPPPIPSGIVSVAGETVVTTSSTSPMPSVNRPPGTTPEKTSVAQPAEGEARSANPQIPPAKLPETSEVTQTASASAATTRQRHRTQKPTDLKSAIPVVYGLKIRPGVGCGTLLFVPTKNGKKNSRDNSGDICTFLKKKWSEVDKQQKSSTAFVTLTEDVSST